MQRFLNIIPGVLFSSFCGFLAVSLSFFLKQMGSTTIAIILGVLINNFFQIPKSFSLGIKFCEKKFLNFAIIVMGLDFNLYRLSSFSFSFLFSIIVLVIFVIFSSILLGKVFRIKDSISFFLGVGNGVCGSSAIAATSHMVNNKKEDIAVSITTINILGLIAIFLLPPFLESFDSHIAGAVIGGSLQAVGHVVAASYFLDKEASQIALAIKMTRVSLLVPIVFLGAFFNKSLYSKGELKTVDKIPSYILFFILCVFISNVYPIPSHFLSSIKEINSFILVTAMSGLGLGISFKSLQENFWKSFSLGTTVFFIQLIILFVCLKFFL